MPKCQCGEEIQFIKLKDSGKSIPCNTALVLLVEPSEKQVLISQDGVIYNTNEPNTIGYEPHWATCPYAYEYRKKRKKHNASTN